MKCAAALGLTRPQFLPAEAVGWATEIQFDRPVVRSDPAARPVLIQDGAGFHRRDGAARGPGKRRIETLPASRPELNPVEGLWDHTNDG